MRILPQHTAQRAEAQLTLVSKDEIAWIIGKGVEGHPGIVPGDQLHTLLHQAPHPVKAHGLPLKVCRGPGLLWILHQQLAHPLKDGGAHIHPGIGNTAALLWLVLDATRLPERAVLNRRHACRDRREHAGGAVDMRGPRLSRRGDASVRAHMSASEYGAA
jgi:hypothetical protein